VRAILTYHSIDPSGSVISVDEATFRGHVAWLASSGVRATTVPGLLALPPEANAVALTFDDACATFATAAWPALRAAGLPATLFVVTDHAGGANSWGTRGQRIPRLDLLGWDALGRLAEEGVTIEAHSRSHPDLRRLTAAARADEMEGCAERIRQELGRRPEGFAYPYGAHDEPVVAQARRTWRWACTAALAPLRGADDPHRLPRLDAYYFRRPTALEAWDTPAFRGRLRLRALARRARAAVLDRGPSR
jgi:peptidoglycan/xylan/chitin deacetylase (PgdA/CDA1 family)